MKLVTTLTSLIPVGVLIFLSSSSDRTVLFEHVYSEKAMAAKPRPDAEGVVHFTLPDSERDLLAQAILQADLSSYKKPEDIEAFISKSKELIKQSGTLKELRHLTTSPNAVVIHNLPIDPHVPATPTDGSMSLNKATFVAESLLVGIGELTGANLIGYESEKEYNHPLIHEGFPIKSSKKLHSRTPKDLAWHQELAYYAQDANPDWLGLICVREGHDKAVTTDLLDNKAILQYVSNKYQQILRQPRYDFDRPTWASNGGNDERKTRRGPILYGTPSAPSLAVLIQANTARPMDAEADEALKALQEGMIQAKPHVIRTHLADGDLFLFNNKRFLHSRSAYNDIRFDGHDRVLFRAYFISTNSTKGRLPRVFPAGKEEYISDVEEGGSNSVNRVCQRQ